MPPTRAFVAVPSLPFVTVVTPVYNGEKFLSEAIQSVLAQDYPHWEYVIVNNRSTDRTAEIAKRYAESNPRIRLVTNETFVNAEENHNLAFRQVPAEASYCKVVSADDRLLPSCLRRMVSFGMEHPGAGIIGSYQRRGREVRWRGLPENVDLLPGTEVCRMALLRGVHVFGNPTSSLYRADLLHRSANFFPHSAPHADTSACYASLHNCDFGFVHEVLTEEGIHDGQLSCQVDELGWGISAYLETLVDYGPRYLSEVEYQTRLRELLDDYYRYLGGSLVKLRSRRFWRFHAQRFAEMALPFDRLRVIGEGLREIGREARNPVLAWRKANTFWAGRKSVAMGYLNEEPPCERPREA